MFQCMLLFFIEYTIVYINVYDSVNITVYGFIKGLPVCKTYTVFHPSTIVEYYSTIA